VRSLSPEDEFGGVRSLSLEDELGGVRSLSLEDELGGVRSLSLEDEFGGVRSLSLKDEFHIYVYAYCCKLQGSMISTSKIKCRRRYGIKKMYVLEMFFIFTGSSIWSIFVRTLLKIIRCIGNVLQAFIRLHQPLARIQVTRIIKV
jgi:hypothetical protein